MILRMYGKIFSQVIVSMAFFQFIDLNASLTSCRIRRTCSQVRRSSTISSPAACSTMLRDPSVDFPSREPYYDYKMSPPPPILCVGRCRSICSNSFPMVSSRHIGLRDFPPDLGMSTNKALFQILGNRSSQRKRFTRPKNSSRWCTANHCVISGAIPCGPNTFSVANPYRTALRSSSVNSKMSSPLMSENLGC